jgi:predicted transcriptional regulator
VEQDFLEFFLDLGTLKVLAELYDKPVRAQDISKKTGMPIATVYRRLDILTKYKKIRMTGELLDTGKRINLYKGKPFEIHIVNGILTSSYSIPPILEKQELLKTNKPPK